MTVERDWVHPSYTDPAPGSQLSTEVLKKYNEFVSNLKGEKQVEQPIHEVMISIGLGAPPNCAKISIQFSDAEGANDAVMVKKRDTAVNEAHKLHELARLVFTPEISAPRPAPTPIQPPNPAAQGASQSGNPVCGICGAMEVLKPAGVSKKTGRPYGSFWFCPNRQSDARHPQ